MSRPRFYAADLAHVHHVGFGAHARNAAPAILKLLHSSGIRQGTLADLGCGSGIFARAAQDAGFSVVGVDASSAMLALARKESPRSRFVKGSLHDVPLPPCAAITMVGEGLNYAVDGRAPVPSLTALFTRMARALQPRGVLLFDVVMNTGKAMNYKSWTHGDGWAVLVETTEKPGSNRLTRHIITFCRSGVAWRRSQETHHVHLFSRTQLHGALTTAGFVVRVAPRYGTMKLGVRRLAFVARKPG